MSFSLYYTYVVELYRIVNPKNERKKGKREINGENSLQDQRWPGRYRTSSLAALRRPIVYRRGQDRGGGGGGGRCGKTTRGGIGEGAGKGTGNGERGYRLKTFFFSFL